VVSLTAVFLALAIGLVVGTAALNGPVADTLNERVNALSKDNQRLRDEVNHLKADANAQEQFATEAAPIMLQNKLAGRRILVVALPSAGDLTDGVQQMLTTAGAIIAGRIEMKDKFYDPASNDHLLDLVTQVLPPSVSGLPTNSDGVETASALLAAVLVDRTPAPGPDAIKTVLSAFSSSGYLSINGQEPVSAEAVVVISGSPYVDRDAPKKNDAVVTMVDQFDKAGPIVVAAEVPAGDGNVVGVVRGDPTLSKTISTVDNVSTAQGRLVTALAVAEQLTGHTGHYGIGAGHTSMMPKASP
jgi:copper transport outer membrane protein MctB